MTSDQAGHLYVNIGTAPGRLVLIDARTLAPKAAWPLKECANPAGLAFDEINHRLFSVCANQIMAVTDSVSGKSIARVVIGRGPDGAAFDADLSLVFSCNAATHKIYLAAAQFGPPPLPTAGAEQPLPHAGVMPDSFVILLAQPK